MHVKYSPKLTWTVIIGSIFWLFIMLVLTMNDYFTLTAQGGVAHPIAGPMSDYQALISRRDDRLDTLSGLMRWNVVPNFRALGPPRGIAGQHDMAAAGEQAGQRFEGLAAHHHRLVHGQRLEPLEVGGQVPGHAPIFANGAVCRHCHDHSNPHSCHLL